VASRSTELTPRRHALRAVVVGGACWLAMPAAYVAAANLNLVPLTGQNMPFLGLNSWSDVVLTGAIASTMITALLTSERGKRSGEA
jgi:cell division protein FtsW (lipid II flippase)